MVVLASESMAVKHPDLDKHPDMYRCGDQIIHHGVSDSVLAYFYDRANREGIFDLLFYEKKMSLYDFLTEYRKPETNTIGCFHVDEEGRYILDGLGWANQICKMGENHSRINVGEGFFRGIVEPNFILRYCQMMMEWVFDNLKVDVIHGVTPVSNRSASIFARKMGFKLVGPLPAGTVWNGKLEDVWLSAMTEDMWDKISPWRVL